MLFQYALGRKRYRKRCNWLSRKKILDEERREEGGKEERERGIKREEREEE